MAYDSNSGKVILFGGEDSVTGLLNDLWTYDLSGNCWTRLEPAGDLPPARSGAGMVYDPASGSAILFGGVSQDEALWLVNLSDTWVYSVQDNRWTQLAPSAASPPARAWHAMTLDSRGRTVIVFGGSDQLSGGGPMADMWLLALEP